LYPVVVVSSGSHCGGFEKIELVGWNEALSSQAKGATNRSEAGTRIR
jgi:hypothetical protein